jgi:hypothetical protein
LQGRKGGLPAWEPSKAVEWLEVSIMILINEQIMRILVKPLTLIVLYVNEYQSTISSFQNAILYIHHMN